MPAADGVAGLSSLDLSFASARVYVPRRTRSGAEYLVSADNLSEDIAVAVAIAEDRWRHNGWQRKKRLLAWAVPGVEQRLKQGRKVRLLTLPGPGMDMAQLAQAWKTIAMRIRRQSRELEFCGTRGIGSINGLPHVHVLCDWGDEWIPQGWFSMAWRDITSYRVVYVNRVKDIGAARYVAANVAGYLADQAGGRMFRSHGWLTGLAPARALRARPLAQ